MTLMNNVAGSELNQDFNQQTNLDSMYFSGKGLAKFASVVYAVRDLSKNPGLANAGLQKLKAAFDVFVQNRQKNPSTVSHTSFAQIPNLRVLTLLSRRDCMAWRRLRSWLP